MLDEITTEEIGTEVYSSDAASAEEFLFGDAEDGETAGVASEQNDAEEVLGEADGPDDSGELEDPDDAWEQDAPAVSESPEDLKVVLSIRGGRAIIGVQQPSADPHIESFDSFDLMGLALQVPAVVERARARWEDEPRHPAYLKPAPPAQRQRQRRQTPVEAATEVGKTEQEQPETPRLF